MAFTHDALRSDVVYKPISEGDQVDQKGVGVVLSLTFDPEVSSGSFSVT